MASVNGPSSSPLRLFVDKERNRVIMGEASGDFIDALLSFLTLPLGTVIRLLSNKQGIGSTEVGCVNNLYQSVQNFNTEVLWNGICKKILLNPRNPCEKLCMKLRFNVDDTEPTRYLVCGSCGGGRGMWLSTFAGARCLSCGKQMDKEMKLEGEKDNNNPEGDGVFVRGKSMYLIFDDLTVLQHSARNTIHQLVQLGYTDFTKLTEISPEVGLHEVLDLLKRAFVSTSSLTDVFLARDDGGSKTVSSFQPIPASQSGQGSDPSYELQITVCRSKNKILYAEAEEDFADFLLSFLTMPLGSTLKLLDGNVNLGSVHNLYKSVKGLNPSWLSSYSLSTSPSLDLKVAAQCGYKNQILDVCEEESPNYYPSHVSGVISKICYHSSSFKLFEPRCGDGRWKVGFVRRPTLFVVMDDLQVLPMASSASSVSFLQKLNTPLDDLQVHKVKIGSIEALNLLGASLTSKAALTNGLSYLVKKPKKEAEA